MRKLSLTKKIFVALSIIILTGSLGIASLPNDKKSFQNEIVIDAPISEVWDVISIHFADIANYSSGVHTSYYLSDVRGLGAERKCELVPQGFVSEIITQWKPYAYLEYEINDGDIGITEGTGIFRFKKDGNKTRLIEEAHIKMEYGLLSWLAGDSFQLAVNENLIGIKHYIEKREKISSNNISSVLKKYEYLNFKTFDTQ